VGPTAALPQRRKRVREGAGHWLKPLALGRSGRMCAARPMTIALLSTLDASGGLEGRRDSARRALFALADV
jgi:hypothetical protein